MIYAHTHYYKHGIMKNDDKPVTVLVSGYFDPLHVGHIEFFEKARALGDRLVVVINSDAQAKLKYGEPVMNEEDRKRIVQALKCVDVACISIDKDRTQCNSLMMLRPDIFANGGDRNQKNIPEAAVCHNLGIIMIDGCGEKIRNSSDFRKTML